MRRGDDSSGGRRTVRIHPWWLARLFGSRDGKARLPRSLWPIGSFAPSQRLLSELGVAEDARVGKSWFGLSRLEAAIHAAAHLLERLAIETSEAEKNRNRCEEKSRAFQQKHKDALLHHAHSIRVRVAMLLALMGGEFYLTQSGLLAVGDSRLRTLAAAGLSVAFVLLCEGVGGGIKSRTTEDPNPPPVWLIAAFAVAAVVMMVTLALARQTAFSAFLAETVSQLGAASSGSATGGAAAPVAMPTGSWIVYFGLQLGTAMAAVGLEFRFHNWRASEFKRLEGRRSEADSHLRASRTREQSAADGAAAARLTWAAAFEAKNEEADEAMAWNRVVQHRYWDHNLRNRSDEIDVGFIRPVPTATRPWRSVPSVEELLGSARFPKPNPIWSKPPEASSNGHREVTKEEVEDLLRSDPVDPLDGGES